MASQPHGPGRDALIGYSSKMRLCPTGSSGDANSISAIQNFNPCDRTTFVNLSTSIDINLRLEEPLDQHGIEITLVTDSWEAHMREYGD